MQSMTRAFTRALIVAATTTIVATAATAADGTSGTITKINRLDNSVAIAPTQSGTVGAAGSAAQQFKVPGGSMLEDIHVGDRVTYTATDSGVISKLQKQ